MKTIDRIKEEARKAYPVSKPQPGWMSDGDHDKAQERRQYAFERGAISERNKAIDEAIALLNKDFSYFTRTTNETNLRPEVIKQLESLRL